MIYRFLRESFAVMVGTLHDLYINIPDHIRIARRQHLDILRSYPSGPQPEADFSRTAIVAIYPSAESIPFTINLLAALRQAQFHIVVISTGRLSAELLQSLLTRCDHLIERRPIGRDFGSYKLALNLLRQWGVYDRIDTLVLANDSMFYHAGFSSVAAAVADFPVWGAVFENYQFHYHVQSFFQVFGRQILHSTAFERFWKTYIPLTSRRHAIHKGEVGLTRAMRRAGFQPTAYYTSNRIITSFNTHIDGSNNLSSFSRVLHAQFGHAYREILRSAKRPQPGQASGELIPRPTDPLLDMDVISELVNVIGDSVERHNPTHFVGLLANYLCGAPIKRDIAYRGIVTIGEVLQCANGYSAAELAAMEADLRARGSPAMFHGLKRILYLRGNL